MGPEQADGFARIGRLTSLVSSKLPPVLTFFATLFSRIGLRRKYPRTCLRGIRKKKDFVSDKGHVLAMTFMPDSRTAAQRADHGEEVSINWEDSQAVLPFTLKLPAAQFGAARLSLVEEVRAITSRALLEGTVFYERSAETGNPHHGNIVFREGLPRHLQTMIAGRFALASDFIARSR